jgi:galactose mutarotase-like enzyme
LPLELERRLELQETKNGWRLQLQYKVVNKSSKPVPWSWAAHPLFAVQEGDRITLPESIRQLRLEGSGGGRLRKGGDIVAWPKARLQDGSAVDLRVADAPESEVGDKLFAGPLTGSENWCSLERPSEGVRVRVTFDVAATPYLGLWICYGGWPERPGPKQMCVAMEPSTAPVDSLAVTGEWSRMLEARDCFRWWMEVEIERIEK